MKSLKNTSVPEKEDLLRLISTYALWEELARRFGLKFGKLQMIIHDGKPTKYTDMESRIRLEPIGTSD